MYERLTSPIINMINDIDSGLRKFRYEKSFTAYRRVSAEEYMLIENNERISSFADFKSTTLVADIALNFLPNGTAHIIVAQLPPLANGAYIAPLSKYEGEKEFLLNKNSKYQIVNKLYDEEKDIKYLFIKVV